MTSLDGVMAVMEAAFDPHYREGWNRRQVTDALALANTHLLLIGPYGEDGESEDRSPAGFALSRHVLGEEELLLIAVDPACRGRGLGRRLLQRQIASARTRGAAKLFLEMRDGNGAEALYMAFGFREIGFRRDYYRFADGTRCDAKTFALDIGEYYENPPK